MIKRILIPSLILCSFLIASVSTVVAADKTMNDRPGDVLDFLTGAENVSSSPNIDVGNIDITEITYSRQNKKITLTLEVKGEIENRGTISDLESEDSVDFVAYIFSLYTSSESYAIYYVNDKCQITYYSTSETKNISDFSLTGSVLTISFNLLNDSEVYDTMEALSYYIKAPNFTGIDDPLNLPETEYQQLGDAVPDVVLDVTIDAPSEGIIWENIDFSGEVDGGTSTSYTWAWDFGDGNTSDEQNPTHKYSEAGTFDVTLYVTDSDGNQGGDYVTLVISDNEPSNGGSQDGDTEESSNSGLIVFVVIIAIIVIAGTAIVIYIIRR